MPTYDYYCTKCKKSFEVFQSMKDEPFVICPENLCQQKRWGKGTVQRQVGTGAGLIFKGSGFYITDYRSEGYKVAQKKDAPAAPETAKADSKPAPSEKPASAEKPKSEKPKPSPTKE
jgi:putative FmdB family regulatory protein